MSSGDGYTLPRGLPNQLRRESGSGVAPHHRARLPQDRTGFYGSVHEAVARRVYQEFLEMPDLRVTAEEARRLFGLAETECAMALEFLTECELLTRRPNGRYAKFRG